MNKQGLHFASYFVLLAVFLAVQWLPPHVHLTAAHAHGGEQHHHSAEIHSHHAVVQHPDAIDSGDPGHGGATEAWVIELNHPQLPTGGQHPDFRPLVVQAEFRLAVPTLLRSRSFPETINPLPDLLPAHVGQPRAPRQFA